MKRDGLGRFLPDTVSYWLQNEDESWEDVRVSPDDIMFPQHRDNKIYPVHTFNINELNT